MVANGAEDLMGQAVLIAGLLQLAVVPVQVTANDEAAGLEEGFVRIAGPIQALQRALVALQLEVAGRQVEPGPRRPVGLRRPKQGGVQRPHRTLQVTGSAAGHPHLVQAAGDQVVVTQHAGLGQGCLDVLRSLIEIPLRPKAGGLQKLGPHAQLARQPLTAPRPDLHGPQLAAQQGQPSPKQPALAQTGVTVGQGPIALIQQTQSGAVLPRPGVVSGSLQQRLHGLVQAARRQQVETRAGGMTHQIAAQALHLHQPPCLGGRVT